MTGAVLLVALGYAAVRALAPESSVRLRLGAGALVGAGICGAILVANQPWALLAITLASLSLILALALLSYPATEQPSNHISANHSPLDLATFAALALYARFATSAPEWSWQNWAETRRDWFFIWGQKAQLFFEHRGIDLTFLQASPNDLSQPDYPWLWPLTVDWLALFHGSFEPRLAGFATVLFAAALLLVFREIAGRTLPPTLASLATLAAVGAACTPYLGLADGPFAAYAGAALLLLDDAIRRDNTAQFRLSALLLGLSANVKNEGIALMVAAALAVALAAGARRVRALWPAFAVGGTWLVARRLLGLSTDLVRGHPLERAAHALTHLGEFLGHFRDVYDPNPWLYLAIGFALAISIRELRRETFLVTAIVAQLAFYLGANLLSPFGVGGQIGGSWGRLLGHLAAPLVFLAARGLASEFDRRPPPEPPRLVEEKRS